MKKRSFTKDDPWGKVLATTAWSIHSTYHTMLGTTSRQLICNRDILHDAKHVADWELIRLHKQKIIEYSMTR
eukprot:4882737-Ditylum_brightwellii.AAC.1